ncbi:MAG: NAD(P)H-dependent oxidoreductase subunit E [Deltaproteobacteria bacterium HGW-Deltaproteobacteria-15]|jgi:NADH-quinone oxidoreductase subunit E|nr:MAG: NAD(P)H-dependent oxidoreductase subunit E [Deltaproteobacteria bacterium HGW-Deltaproteobacteria-15]PKO02864.1 MAG: NAD(P)H-dependent oxidoreductase subunit E [Chloroflexi bacterium HGW-Chloroflexi-5]
MDDHRIDEIVNKYEGKPNSVIMVLMDIQHENRWLPREVLEKVSNKLGVPLSDILHIATFYKTFSLKPQGRHEVHVCAGTSCHQRGSAKILEKVRDLIGINPGETTSDLRFSLENGSCLGCCTLGPEIVVDGVHHNNITPDDVEDILKNYK